MTRPMFIAISGLVGTGKSSVVTLVAQKLGITPFTENLDRIPGYKAWLENRGSLYSAQIEFLERAFLLQKEACETGGIQERTIYENYEVAVKYYYENGLLSQDQFDSITTRYKFMSIQVKRPDLLFHLTASAEVILERTNNRGRPDDHYVTKKQILKLEKYYQTMLEAWKLCPVINIDTSWLDLNKVVLEIIDEINRRF